MVKQEFKERNEHIQVDEQKDNETTKVKREEKA